MTEIKKHVMCHSAFGLEQKSVRLLLPFYDDLSDSVPALWHIAPENHEGLAKISPVRRRTPGATIHPSMQPVESPRPPVQESNRALSPPRPETFPSGRHRAVVAFCYPSSRGLSALAGLGYFP